MFDVVDFPDANPKCLAFSSPFLLRVERTYKLFWASRGHTIWTPGTCWLGMAIWEIEKWQEQFSLSYTVPLSLKKTIQRNSNVQI